MLYRKTTLLLDMNKTFMLDEDRFDGEQNYSKHYKEVGGELSKGHINVLITDVLDYLSLRYADEKYRHNFLLLKTSRKAHSQSTHRFEII